MTTNGGAVNRIVGAIETGDLDDVVQDIADGLDYEQFRAQVMAVVMACLLLLLHRRFPPDYDVRSLTRFLGEELPRIKDPDTGPDFPRVVERWLRWLLGESELAVDTDGERVAPVITGLISALARRDQVDNATLTAAVQAVVNAGSLAGAPDGFLHPNERPGQ